MITSRVIDSHVRNTLRENLPGLSTYSDAEIVMYINAALSWLVGLDSSCSTTTGSIPLVKGMHQTLPEGGIRLMSVWSNDNFGIVERINSRVQTGLAPVRNTPFSEAINSFADWGSAPERTNVTNIVFDSLDAKHFMVYPPNKGDGKLVCTYARLFPKVVAIDDVDMGLGYEYLEAISFYTAYRAALRKNEKGDVVTDKVAADFFYGKAREAVSFKVSADLQTTAVNTVRA